MTQKQAGLEIRRGDDRGVTDIGWLQSRHSFSFGGYVDPVRMGFRSLRVINDDWVKPNRGFGTHPHRDMEIVTWVLSGALRHEDSTGTRGLIGPGELQLMSAGRGIRHSEMNASATEPVHLLQIWIEPNQLGLEPAYQQRSFDATDRAGKWQVLASSDGRGGSLTVHQSAVLSVVDLASGRGIASPTRSFAAGYLHVAFGRVRIGDEVLASGDAVIVDDETPLAIEALEQSQVLYFDLA